VESEKDSGLSEDDFAKSSVLSPFYSFCPWPALPPPVKISLTTVPEHPCPYLPDRLAMNRAFLCRRMPPELYHDLMNAGFRRSGTYFYQPVCRGCRECQPLRVPVDRFTPSKSQRRAWRRNGDLIVTAAPPEPTPEKFDLYTRYLRDRHELKPEDDFNSFVRFLYTSPVDSIEISYRDASGKLIGVGICDVCVRSLSGVYFYFDPEESRRGLGTFSTMWEIDYAMRRKMAHYYFGFWVRECDAMRYKATFRPNEVLHPDGVWRENSIPGKIEMTW
jgi:arginyl-tRNA--protein-N-Asp/Glu arginylyltransferase